MNYSSGNTVILLVDPYNDFLSSKGQAWFLVKPVVKQTQLLEHLHAIRNAARRNGIRIAYSLHHRYHEGSFAGRKYLHPTQVSQRISGTFSRGKFGGEIFHTLSPAEEDIISSEHMCSSGFAETDLHAQLQAIGITHLVIVGMITNTCIEATTRSAVDLDYHVTLVTDAVAAFSPKEHAAAIKQNYGQLGHIVTDTATLLNAMRAKE